MNARLPEPGADATHAAMVAPPSLTIHYDDAAKIIRVVGCGMWTVEYIDAHFAALGQLARRIRAQDGAVFVLVDLSRAPVQTAEVAKHIHAGTERLFGAADRIALIVQSSLVKSQMKRVSWSENTAVFVSPDAAETWLFAHRP
jgi:hypothetical protein